MQQLCIRVYIKIKDERLGDYWPPFWIFPAILNYCLNNIITNRLSYIEVIYSSEKNHLNLLNRTRYMNIYSFLAAIFDFSRHFKNKAKSEVAGKLIS